MILLTFNLHTHTTRCGHAIGTDEEYVLEAINGTYKLLGFSDHVMLPGIVHDKMRAPISELDEYFLSINYLKEKYKEMIDIKIGFEAEYIPQFVEYYKMLYREKGLDYLILGQHLQYDENGNTLYYWRKKTDDMEKIIKYKNDLIEGMKSGLFLYVAHPDIFMHNVTTITDEIIGICREICNASIKYDIPLELNLGGIGYSNLKAQIYGTNPYPNHYFWEIAKEIGCKCVVGVDAHNPGKLTSYKCEFVVSFLKRFDLKPMTLDEIDVYLTKNKLRNR